MEGKVNELKIGNKINKARAKAKGVSDEQFADNWDKIFAKKNKKK